MHRKGCWPLYYDKYMTGKQSIIEHCVRVSILDNKCRARYSTWDWPTRRRLDLTLGLDQVITRPSISFGQHSSPVKIPTFQLIKDQGVLKGFLIVLGFIGGFLNYITRLRREMVNAKHVENIFWSRRVENCQKCWHFSYLFDTKIDKIETCERLFFSIAVPWQCFLLCCRLCGLRSSALLHTPHWPHQFSQPIKKAKCIFTTTTPFRTTFSPHNYQVFFSLQSNQ